MEPVEFEFRGRAYNLYTHGGEDLFFRNISRRRSFYELDLLKAVRDAREPGRAIFDVGANIGDHAVFFAGVMGQKVTSFEPFPKNYEILARNVAENGLSHTVKAEPIGLGDADGQADAEDVKPHNFGMVRLRKSASGTIPIARLDDSATSGAVTGTI
jgi:FkbM family methyltransferase